MQHTATLWVGAPNRAHVREDVRLVVKVRREIGAHHLLRRRDFSVTLEDQRSHLTVGVTGVVLRTGEVIAGAVRVGVDPLHLVVQRLMLAGQLGDRVVILLVESPEHTLRVFHRQQQLAVVLAAGERVLLKFRVKLLRKWRIDN